MRRDYRRGASLTGCLQSIGVSRARAGFLETLHGRIAERVMGDVWSLATTLVAYGHTSPVRGSLQGLMTVVQARRGPAEVTRRRSSFR